jgi:hypothetical protein
MARSRQLDAMEKAFVEVVAKMRSKRTQFQVTFWTSAMPPPSNEAGPFPDPRFVDAGDLLGNQE